MSDDKREKLLEGLWGGSMSEGMANAIVDSVYTPLANRIAGLEQNCENLLKHIKLLQAELELLRQPAYVVETQINSAPDLDPGFMVHVEHGTTVTPVQDNPEVEEDYEAAADEQADEQAEAAEAEEEDEGGQFGQGA